MGIVTVYLHQNYLSIKIVFDIQKHIFIYPKVKTNKSFVSYSSISNKIGSVY